MFFEKYFLKILNFLENYRRSKLLELKLSKIKAGKNVKIGYDTHIDGNILIGDNTYINNYGRIVTGKNSEIKIGENCAIGRFFSCASRTHDLQCPTSTVDYPKHLIKEKSISIGNNVWIGDKVTIKEGVEIGDFAIVGANSVVVRNVNKFEIVGGVPSKHIRYNKSHYKYYEVMTSHK